MTLCLVCGQPSTLLCDFAFGGVIEEVADEPTPHIFIDGSKMPYRCDMPLCQSCATNRGHIFFCGKDSGIDTFDYCPLHAHQHEDALMPITPRQAESMRADAWAKIIRQSMRVVK